MARLLGVPNVAEGRDDPTLAAIETAFGPAAELLDRHTDADHDRTVFTLAAEEDTLGDALLAGAKMAIATIDMSGYEGLHPAVGALDVCPVVWFDEPGREPALALGREIAARVADLGVPVFLYGALASSPERSERAYFRNGGLPELALRMESGELAPDFGPPAPHPRAGATLVTARPPLAAFNLELDTDDVEIARSIAAGLRESGGGIPGVRAIGIRLANGRAQVSTNVHNPAATPLALVVERVRALAAPLGARPVEAELVGLLPERAVEGYPAEVPIRGFDPELHLIERRLALPTD